MARQRDIFIAFFRSGIFGFGGGPAAIPLVHKEVVGNFKWMSDDEFSDVLAIGNALPGPINTKMVGYIGYQIGGVIGMLNAIIASIVPTIVMMIIVLSTLKAYKDQPWVAGMTKGVVPVVGVMLAQLTWQFVNKSKQDLGLKLSFLMIIVSLVLTEYFNLHPGFIIVVVLAYALLKPIKQKQDLS